MRALVSFNSPLGRVVRGASAAVAAAVALGAVPVHAQTLKIEQMGPANIYGTIQSGRQVRPLDVTQKGRSNATGIVQIGSNAGASVTQTGQRNTAFVGQYRDIAPRGGRLHLP